MKSMKINFNGISLTSNKSKLDVTGSPDILVRQLSERERNRVVTRLSGKDIRFTKSGLNIRKAEASLNTTAFTSILNILRVPVSYAKRIPHELLIVTLDELISKLDNINLILENNEVLGAFLSSEATSIRPMTLLECVMWGENPRPLSFAILDKHSVSCFFRTKTFNKFSLGLEICISDTCAHP